MTASSRSSSVLEKTKIAEERDRTPPIVPLDQAILESVTQGARGDERKLRDFLGGIMLVGGAACDGATMPTAKASTQSARQRVRRL